MQNIIANKPLERARDETEPIGAFCRGIAFDGVEAAAIALRRSFEARSGEPGRNTLERRIGPYADVVLFVCETKSDFPLDGLLERFENARLEQDNTYITEDHKKHNNNNRKLVAIKDELNSRGPDARKSLLRLFASKNRQVRLQAAKFVYPVAREEAKKCLQELARAPFPDDHSLSAGMCLSRLEEAPD
jgi:hypothetical protein